MLKFVWNFRGFYLRKEKKREWIKSQYKQLQLTLYELSYQPFFRSLFFWNATYHWAKLEPSSLNISGILLWLHMCNIVPPLLEKQKVQTGPENKAKFFALTLYKWNQWSLTNAEGGQWRWLEFDSMEFI